MRVSDTIANLDSNTQPPCDGEARKRARGYCSKKEEGGTVDLIINYDSDADVLVLKLREGSLADEELLDNDVVLGYDSDGKVVSLEILDASRKGLLNVLVELAKARKEAVELILSKIS